MNFVIYWGVANWKKIGEALTREKLRPVAEK
jgi:hypothetical protein